MPRIIGYYQTFTGLHNMCNYTHVHLAALHFGIEADGQPYMHLNDRYPTDQAFDTVWADLKTFSVRGGRVVLMIGGAGGGFSTLFARYAECYPMLRNLLLIKSDVIDGIDLDVEEPVALTDLVRLAADLQADFPFLFFTAAPMATDLQTDAPGMGGFCYKDLETALATVNVEIAYYNGQFYDSNYTVDAYNAAVANGYEAERVVMGQLAPQDMTLVLPVLRQLFKTYDYSFGGVFTWEYCNAVPTPTDWADAMVATICN